ncbi:MAG: GNAT family N-acetyltransferase [Pseudomonadota bacterium]
MHQMRWIAAEDVGQAMDKTLQTRWHALQASDAGFRSPFFSLAFFQIVARHRPDVDLCVLEADGDITGLFPFHRRPGGRGVPLAGPIADYQGILGMAENLTADALLRACALTAYDFDHGLRANPVFLAEAFRDTSSPLIDLEGGYDAWYQSRRKATSAIKTMERKLRKLAREVGPLRFEAHDPDPAVWTRLITWKRSALADKGVGLILDTPWVEAVVRDIAAERTPDFSGCMSTLYAGDRLVAAHFGMRSATAWHWWFPVFDPQMSAYSPGLGLLRMCAEQAAKDGLAELDLGRGTERYKREFANGARGLCEGSLERALTPQGAVRRLRKSLHRAGEKMLSDHHIDLKRRAFNRLLQAGRM